MPKCNECDNDKEFIVTYMEFERMTYEGNKVIYQEAGDRERLDYWIDDKYKPECAECNSTNVEGEF